MGKRSIATAIIGVMLLQPIGMIAHAQVLNFDQGFNPNHILDNSDIFDVHGMTYDNMVRFLRAKGTLADTKMPDIDGIMKPIPDIIWRVANSYKINPKYLLALIQKEQSLVEDPNPTQKQFDWATGYGVCDSCSKNDPSIQNFKGFASQLEWAAKQYREKYLQQLLGNGETLTGTAPGKTIAIDGIQITPVNDATAMLYTYTPHIHGNLNLWRIWRRWFSLSFPNGTIVQAKTSGKTYQIRFGEKWLFASPSVLASLVDPNKIVMVSDTELTAYPDGPEIKFPKFALLKDLENRIWLLTGESKRHIKNMAAFHKFGFNMDEVITLDSDSELTEYPTGDPITVKTQFPQGVVMQNKTDKSLWYVEGKTKQYIPDDIFLSLYFRGRRVIKVFAATLETYATKKPYQFHDGELIRATTAPSVYVVEQGVLHPIPSSNIFKALGWQWKNVVTIPDSLITMYTVGTAIADNALPQPTILTTSTATSTTETSATNTSIL